MLKYVTDDFSSILQGHFIDTVVASEATLMNMGKINQESCWEQLLLRQL